jgi:hypothetical protein
MHFCPRPSCRKAYHQNCLIKAKYIETTASGRDVRLLISSPDTNEIFTLADIVTRSESPKTKPSDRSKKKDNAFSISPKTPTDFLAHLPPELVRVAQHPMIKGGQFQAGGVAGNISAIALARRIVYDALGGTPVPDNWEEMVDVETALFLDEKLPALICPKCNGSI